MKTMLDELKKHTHGLIIILLSVSSISCTSHIDVDIIDKNNPFSESLFLSKDDSINIQPIEVVELEVGQTLDLYSMTSNNSGNYSNIPVSWSLVNNIGNMNVMLAGSKAEFTATNTGAGYIQVDNGTTTKIVSITVIDTRPSQIRLVNNILDFTTESSTTIDLEFIDSQGNKTLNYNGDVILSISNDPSGRNAVFVTTGTTSITATAVNGIVNFGTVSLDQPGTGYTFDLSVPGIPSLTSNAFNISGATRIYRSVGFNSTIPIQTAGVIELTISQKRAEFSADLANNIGVGDVIQYDSTGDNLIDSTAIIQRRISAREFVLHQPNYTLPNAVVNELDWSICRASSSLGNAEDLIENTTCLDDNLVSKDIDSDTGGRDIAAANEQWNIAFYADASHSSNLINDDGWTTAVNNYLRFFTPHQVSEVGISQRHSGIWNSSKANMTINEYYPAFYNLRQRYYRIEGFQINNQRIVNGDGGGVRVYPGLVYTDTGEIHITDNIITKQAVGIDNSESNGIRVLGSTIGTKVLIANNIIYGFKKGVHRSHTSNNLHVFLYNNTVGEFTEDAFLLSRYGTNMSYKVRNNLIENNNTTGNEWRFSSSAGTNDIYEYNQSTDGSAIGTNNQVGTVDFIDAAKHDYRLQTIDTIARDTGADLRADPDFSITKDIKGQEIISTFHMGAHSY